MKKIALALFAFSALVLCSCEREDLSAFIGTSLTDDATDITSDSFEFHAAFTLEGGVATSSAIGVFMDVKPGVCSGQYAKTTDPVKMENGATYFSYKFSNIDSKNERIFKAGTTVYYRAYLRVEDTDYDTYTYVYGEEKSFTVPVSKCTLMVYGEGGGNLDYSNAKNLLAPMMKEGRDGDLQVTFLYKPSASYQEGGEYGGYNDLKGAQRWVMPFESRFKDIWNENIESTNLEYEYILYAYNRFAVFSEQVGDKNYDLSNPQNLADFINWSMEKCPAESYILLMDGHGNGWDLKDDGVSHVNTKAQLFDDNQGNSSMSLIDFIDGISSSEVGGLNGVIFGESMMATMENIVATSAVADNMLASQEQAYSLSGQKVMEILRESITDETGVFAAFIDLADDYCQTYDDKYTDMGAYNLDMTSTLLSSISEVSSFFSEKYTNSSDWKTVIDKGVTKTLWAFATTESEDQRSKILEIKETMKNWENLSDNDKDIVIGKINTVNGKGQFQYCFYDLLAQTVKVAEEYQPSAQSPSFANEIESLRGYLSDYKTALKGMSYIACGQKKTADTPYEYTSPSICLQSLCDGVYGPITRTNLYGYAKADQLSREEAIAAYTGLAFDNITSWSEYLKKAQTSGAPYFSDDRQLRQSGQ